MSGISAEGEINSVRTLRRAGSMFHLSSKVGKVLWNSSHCFNLAECGQTRKWNLSSRHPQDDGHCGDGLSSILKRNSWNGSKS